MRVCQMVRTRPASPAGAALSVSVFATSTTTLATFPEYLLAARSPATDVASSLTVFLTSRRARFSTVSVRGFGLAFLDRCFFVVDRLVMVSLLRLRDRVRDAARARDDERDDDDGLDELDDAVHELREGRYEEVHEDQRQRERRPAEWSTAANAPIAVLEPEMSASQCNYTSRARSSATS